MSRGRPPGRGLDDAVAIARKRGCVMKFEYGFENSCDLLIRTVSSIILIRLRRMEKITATLSEMEHACSDIIAELRLFPASPQIALEVWPYSRHGTYRFFRLSGTGLIELGRDGEPAQPAGPVENGGSPQEPGQGPAPGPEPGDGIPSPTTSDPVPALTLSSAPPSSPRPLSPTEPPLRRWSDLRIPALSSPRNVVFSDVRQVVDREDKKNPLDSSTENPREGEGSGRNVPFLRH